MFPSTLFGVESPPAIWIQLSHIENDISDERHVSVRIRQAGYPSIYGTAKVSRYSHADEILMAIGTALRTLQHSDSPVSNGMWREILNEQLDIDVAPF